MGTSIRDRTHGKNRWIGKAMFTASHESKDRSLVSLDSSSSVRNPL
jgi:hypothetical protein